MSFTQFAPNWSKEESLEEKKSRAIKVVRFLKKKFPEAKIALNYGNNIQLLAAVILSAQCTDKKVNEVTVELFKKYKTAADFASANPSQFEKEIRPTGFYRQCGFGQCLWGRGGDRGGHAHDSPQSKTRFHPK